MLMLFLNGEGTGAAWRITAFFFAYDSDVDMEGRRCCLLIIW